MKSLARRGWRQQLTFLFFFEAFGRQVQCTQLVRRIAHRIFQATTCVVSPKPKPQSQKSKSTYTFRTQMPS